MAFTFLSLIGCPGAPPATWRPEDYDAYKIVRVLSGRRIAGLAWLRGEGDPVRVSHARDARLFHWFGERTADAIGDLRTRDPRPALVPFPGPNRVVGAPPSGSRALAQAISGRTGLRVLDVLRWRQPMPRCRPCDRQVFIDNLVVTGSPVRGDIILVADCVTRLAAVEGTAARLRQTGTTVVFAVSAGRVDHPWRREPFSPMTERLGDGG